MVISWEWNFNLGTILPLVFTAGIFYAVTKADIKALKEAVVEIKGTLVKQTETIAQLAVQKAQLESQAAILAEMQKLQRVTDARLYDLSRGRGFIKGDRPGIDGEYSEG